MRFLPWRLGTVMMVMAVLAVEFCLCAPALDIYQTVSISNLAWMHIVVAILAVCLLCALLQRRRRVRTRAQRGAEYSAALRFFLIGSHPFTARPRASTLTN